MYLFHTLVHMLVCSVDWCCSVLCWCCSVLCWCCCVAWLSGHCLSPWPAQASFWLCDCSAGDEEGGVTVGLGGSRSIGRSTDPVSSTPALCCITPGSTSSMWGHLSVVGPRWLVHEATFTQCSMTQVGYHLPDGLTALSEYFHWPTNV